METEPTDPWILLQASVIGLSIAAPVGPIAVLCVQRTLLNGRKSGFISGLGAATADAVYGSIAGFGLTFISNILIAQQIWLRLFGGIFLCYLGLRTLTSKPNQEPTRVSKQSLSKDYVSTFLLTITNPVTILSFLAVFVSIGGSAADDYGNALFFVTGIFTGSMLWWTILAFIVGMLFHKFSAGKLRLINTISGLVLFGFGAYLLLSLLFSLF